MCITLHVKYRLFMPEFNKTCICSTDFRKNQISNFIKILPVGAELLRADGRRDTTKLKVAYLNFVYVLEKSNENEDL
jgi:hypothetical protein